MRLSVRNSVITIFVITVINCLHAQVKNSPAAFELYQSKKLWHNTNNAAGSLIDNPFNYSVLSAGYNFYSGDFHRPQQGDNGSEAYVKSEGALKLKGFYAWGAFSYTHENLDGAAFNASLIDPYRGMPYIVADTNKSEWLKQHYDLRFRISSIPSGKFTYGLGGIYKASIGAKQRDVRTQNLFYYFNLQPGITYSLNKKNYLGLNGEYYGIKEEANNSNVNTYIDQQYYELYGLGTAVQGIGSGRTTNYIGSAFGGNFQYNFIGNKINMLAEAGYTSKTEDVEISFSVPKKDASVKDKLINAKILLTAGTKDFTHFFTAQFLDRKIDGIQNVTKFDNSINQRKWVIISSDVRSKYNTMTAIVKYDLVKERSDEYSWKSGLGAKYESIDDKYLIPASYKKATNVTINVYGKKNVFISENLVKRLLIGLDLSYNQNLSGEYKYTGQHKDYPVVNDLENADLQYLMANYQSAEVSAVYSQKLNNTNKANLFFKLNFKYVNTTDFSFNNRYYGQVSIGSNF